MVELDTGGDIPVIWPMAYNKIIYIRHDKKYYLKPEEYRVSIESYHSNYYLLWEGGKWKSADGGSRS